MRAGGRYLRELDLHEVSLVTFPMQEEAGIDFVKSADEMTTAEIKRFFEKLSRDAGYSSTEAKTMLSKLCARDATEKHEMSLADQIRIISQL